MQSALNLNQVVSFLCLCCLVVLILMSSVFSGTIHPELQDKLRARNHSDMIHVVLSVAGGISACELNAYLDSTCETLSDRRREGVLLLERLADETQGDLLDSLYALKNAGLADNIESDWLTNRISVDLVASVVPAMSRRSDVIEAFQYPEMIPIVPDNYRSPSVSSVAGVGTVEDNIRYIGADSAWAMGYTGEGRIVCVHDGHGVDGSHPALYSNWKGHDGNPTAAWDGAFSDEGLPLAGGPTRVHGTHIAGIMVGHDDVTGDTIGVAPGAEWIGGGWYWAANPDGNPYTTDDVPDVINISFGSGGTCGDLYWKHIDMTEALGIVNIISAGNFGSAPYSITSPADRAQDSLTNFAVGSINDETGAVWWSSSRGPSTCDSVSIKPNVTAPGVSIRSSVPGGLYEYHGGTSMAAPHVAGAVAILRQYAPNASVREIKEALLAGCTPRGTPSPNNDYGWGVINIPASLEYLSPQAEADIRLVTFDRTPVDLRDTIRSDLTLNNRGRSIDSVYMSFCGDCDGVTVLSDSIHFGSLGLKQEVTGHVPLMAVVHDTMYEGSDVTIDYTIHGSGGFQRDGVLSVRVGIAGERETFTHINQILRFTITNYGQCTAFKYDYPILASLTECALMLGTDTAHVSDAFRDMEMDPDNDFWCNTHSGLYSSIPGEYAEEEASCTFDDGLAENRIGVRVHQRSYSWYKPPNDHYVILEYVLENISRSNIENLYAGLALNWTLNYLGKGLAYEGNYSRDENLGYVFRYTDDSDSTDFRGVAVLNDEGPASYRVFTDSLETVGLSDSLKFELLSEGFVNTNFASASNWSVMHVLSTGPFSLSRGECDTAYFAIIGTASFAELKAAAVQARDMAQWIITEDALPDEFTLRQNYPNPFNGTTRIGFAMREPGHVRLEVLNVLGQRVVTLVDRQMSGGCYSVDWSGTDSRGESVATGVYFYRLTTDHNVESRKMILLK